MLELTLLSFQCIEKNMEKVKAASNCSKMASLVFEKLVLRFYQSVLIINFSNILTAYVSF